MYQSKTVSLVIPAKNEARNLPNILAHIPDFVDEVLLIDGNSSDATVEVAKSNSRISKIVTQKNRGKGGALSRGFLESSGEIVIMIDADGSMDLSELGRFAEAVASGKLIVKGSRYVAGGGSDDITKFRSLGNLFLTHLANAFFQTKWTDLAYGYAAFDRRAINMLEISYFDSKVPGFWSHRQMTYGQGFEIETLLFCRAARRGITVTEIASWERNRVFGSSNLRAISDGTRALIAIIVERTRSRREIHGTR